MAIKIIDSHKPPRKRAPNAFPRLMRSRLNDDIYFVVHVAAHVDWYVAHRLLGGRFPINRRGYTLHELEGTYIDITGPVTLINED